MSRPDGSIGDHPVDDLAAYAVDALDGAEREAVDDHLTLCLTCRDDLAGYHETLALLAPEEAPPAALWERIATSIGAPDTTDVTGLADVTGPTGPNGTTDVADPAAPHDLADPGDDVVRPMRPGTPPAPARAGRWPLPAGWMAVAAGVVVALGLGGIVGFALGSSGDDDADITSLAQQASEDPGGELATLVSPDGEAVARVVADEDGAYLVLDGLENLPEGRAYQLWSLTESPPVSLGMLGREGTNTVAFRLPPTITDLAISEAPTSGDATPAGQFIASGAITAS